MPRSRIKRWNTAYAALKKYRKEHPGEWPLWNYVAPDALRLGMWCHNQRAFRKRGALAVDRVRKVEGSVGEGFWFGRYTMHLAATYGDNGEKLSATRTIWVVPWRKLWPWAIFAAVVAALAVVARKRFAAAWYVLRTGQEPPR